ncbi:MULTISPECIES: 1-acyl-sn-glycerol-3-phosphate acyltransferase [Spirulina sp. CCY15215]|uniref:1-acyl-sn-glycerol-3-phosphate acyltransferase n=1 Tax=Spirulina sp. CCY15215 TaxID=2767591 RepID=UPI00194F3322|nr:1-acyl-sn-glycerol-3-phosphate acyltransferase [Spirulina major]
MRKFVRYSFKLKNINFIVAFALILVVKTAEFYPAKLTPLFVRLIQSLSYGIAHTAYHVDLQVSDRDLDKLKAIEGDRVVLMPNHPSLDDGIVLFLLSTRLGQLFNYLVAQDNFNGWQGEFLQRIGSYSIKRGVGDRASIAYTLNLLRQNATKLVIFAEGGCSYQNDTVMPFRSGAVQMPLQVLHKLAKETSEVPNFFLVPISLKYRYRGSMDKAIADSLQQLETRLGIIPTTEAFYPRLRAIGERVVTNLEKEYEIAPPKTHPLLLNQRIENIKTRLLTNCEEKLGITSASHLPMRERVYKIQALLDTDDEPSPVSETLYKATVRLLNFDAIYDGYVAAAPTPERFLDTLIRLEREVFSIDRPQPKGYRHAFLKIGAPVNLKDYLHPYKQNRTETIETITRQMQQAVQENLQAIAPQ